MKKLLLLWVAAMSLMAQTPVSGGGGGAIGTTASFPWLCKPATNSGTAYACTPTLLDGTAVTPAQLAAPAAGQQIVFIPDTSNTGPATLSIDGSTSKGIRKGQGTSLASGDMTGASPVYTLGLNATGTIWLIVGPPRIVADSSITVGGTLLNPSLSVAAAQLWGPSSPNPNVAPPVLSNWTFLNTSSAGSAVDVPNGVLLNSVTGNDIKQLTVATPGTSGTAFTATAHISGIAHDVLQTFGLVIGLTGDSKIHLLEFGATTSGQAFRVSDWNSATSFAATVVNYTQFGFNALWMRIKYDGTNIILSLSPTGNDDNSFMQIYSVAAGSFLGAAPAKIGFFAYSQTTGNPVIAVLDYWNVTQP
jgi:hypothetical protein